MYRVITVRRITSYHNVEVTSPARPWNIASRIQGPMSSGPFEADSYFRCHQLATEHIVILHSRHTPFTRTPVHGRVLPSMPIRESLMSMLIKFRILFYEIHLFSAFVLLLKISYKLLYCPCTETNSSLPVLSRPSVIPWSGLFKTVHEAASEADPIYLRLTLDRLLIRTLNLLSCLSFVPQRQTQYAISATGCDTDGTDPRVYVQDGNLCGQRIGSICHHTARYDVRTTKVSATSRMCL